MRFLYFLPGQTSHRVDAEVLERYGLRELFRGRSVRSCLAAGPLGEGALVVDDREKAMVFSPGTQLWAQRLDGRAWTGMWKDSPPTPDELLRDDSMDGHGVLLRDKRRWVIPVARRMPEGTGLPEVLIYTADGIRHQVAPEFQGLWADACRLWDAGGELAVEEMMALAARALAVNYHLGKDELNLLNLVTSANLAAIAGALIDSPTLAALRAVSDPKAPGAAAAAASAPIDASPMPSGSADCCPATGRRSQTSAG